VPPPKPQAPINQRYAIACEGDGDSSFFVELCSAWDITSFHIGPAGGVTEFSRYLMALVEATSLNPLDAILVVGDNNGGVDESFRRVQNQVRLAQFKTDLSTPNAVFELAARSKQSTATVIMMIPFDDKKTPLNGCLESLLLEALTQPYSQLLPCVDDFRRCVDLAAWSVTRDHKMRLRGVIAAGCKDDPNLSLRFAVDPKKEIVDLTHSCLAPIADFLTNFGPWVTTERIKRWG